MGVAELARRVLSLLGGNNGCLGVVREQTLIMSHSFIAIWAKETSCLYRCNGAMPPLNQDEIPSDLASIYVSHFLLYMQSRSPKTSVGITFPLRLLALRGIGWFVRGKVKLFQTKFPCAFHERSAHHLPSV